ncbi:MAG: ADP-ribosylglycohydrolase family protein [bacterium]|nr:ADP-ribosylglycohydrolase family protein [bacterium]
MTPLRDRIRSAWQGRISGCQLGKPVELLAMRQGWEALDAYLKGNDAFPLRDYVPAAEDSFVASIGLASCRGHITRSEPDDDINYTTLALLMLEEHGLALTTEDVARTWLLLLPAGATFTAERAAYRTLMHRAHEWFAQGAEPGFDLAECSDNPYSDWIGAQIRADLYGWVVPGRSALAADLARRDAALSHRGDGIHGATFVAALGAAIPDSSTLSAAVDLALEEVPVESETAAAVQLGRKHAGDPSAHETIRDCYRGLSPVHTVNNLALVVWALLSHPDDFGAAIGDAVAAGLDTDCNGATVGALWGLQGKAIPEAWTEPWQGRVGLSLAGYDELPLETLVDRTTALAEKLS